MVEVKRLVIAAVVTGGHNARSTVIALIKTKMLRKKSVRDKNGCRFWIQHNRITMKRF